MRVIDPGRASRATVLPPAGAPRQERMTHRSDPHGLKYAPADCCVSFLGWADEDRGSCLGRPV
jgi:hypothetical protein